MSSLAAVSNCCIYYKCAVSLILLFLSFATYFNIQVLCLFSVDNNDGGWCSGVELSQNDKFDR